MAGKGLSEQLWLVTLPNGHDSPDTTLAALAKGTQDRHLCRLHRFEVPALNHGTLDSLVALSDDLGKYNSQVEGIARKVERQYLETLTASGEQFEELTVDGTSIEAYMRNWTWDYARYQHQGKKLSELVQQILSMTGQMDEELKKLTTAHSEKAQLLAALDRKKNVNLSVSEFEDFLTPEMVARLDVSDDEHLRKVFVAMPRSSEAEFLREYVNIGLSIGIEFQGEKLPVVAPGSAKLVLASGEQVMYTLTVLKGKHEAGFYEQAAAGGGGAAAGGGGAPLSADAAAAAAAAAAAGAFVAGKSVDFIEPLKNKFRERRMVFRTFAYDEKKSGGVEGQVDKAKSDVLESHVNLLRWCKVHFSMIFPALIHLKVISSFVESVLRYGVPVNFLAVFLDPNLKREKELKKQLVDTILHLRPELKDARGNFDKDEEEDDDMDSLPFVSYAFPVIGIKG